jgi:uncharacterized protein (TIGR00159 family)
MMVGIESVINFLSAITFSEIIDIILVAILLYTGIVWSQRTRAAFVVRGIAILGAIYLVARLLDLQMIAWVLQGFFAIFLVMIVVIFQEELRQMFEWIAVWSLGRKRTPALGSSTADILVRTVADLARNRTGALIVIRGNDPLERHITGGIALDGMMSETLLKNLFYPHSPGHDGAVIIENDRITRFAVHLPLSKDFAQLASRGTRHSAALGLADLTDALCIVASEERGTVSVARDGRLRQLADVQELGSVIHNFLNDRFPPQEPGVSAFLRLQLFRKNWLVKALALSLAIGFWYVFVPGARIVQVSYDVPVSVENIPPDYQIESIDPSAVSVMFTGPRRAFYFFDVRKVTVVIDASLAQLGRRTFTLAAHHVRHPPEVSVQDLSPSTVRLSFKKVSAD